MHIDGQSWWRTGYQLLLYTGMLTPSCNVYVPWSLFLCQLCGTNRREPTVTPRGTAKNTEATRSPTTRQLAAMRAQVCLGRSSLSSASHTNPQLLHDSDLNVVSTHISRH